MRWKKVVETENKVDVNKIEYILIRLLNRSVPIFIPNEIITLPAFRGQLTRFVKPRFIGRKKRKKRRKNDPFMAAR